MMKITVPNLLKSFRQRIDNEQIQFIRGDTKTQVLRLLDDLIDQFKKRPSQADWYERHKRGEELWSLLVTSALKDLDPASKGNARLIEFLGSATEFEDALYGLERHYRDHTLHVLWVYLLGDRLLSNSLKKIYNNNLDWYLYDSIRQKWQEAKNAKSAGELRWRSLNQEGENKKREILDAVNTHKDAAWCIIALCHDLGYSLSKLAKINNLTETVLSFFDHDISRVGYSLRMEHQFLTKQFLELMADDMYLVDDPKQEEALIKLFRDDETYWKLCDALEKREHGILSAFVMYKLLGTFGAATIRGPAEAWGLDNSEAEDTLAKGLILFAIAQHDFYHADINQLGSFADLLILVDEIEEFSRWGSRPLVSRPYTPTIANVAIDIKLQNGKAQIKIIYTVDKSHGESLEKFFARKANKLYMTYALTAEDDRPERVAKPCLINEITMLAEKGDATCLFSLGPENFWAEMPQHDQPTKTKRYDLSIKIDQKTEGLYLTELGRFLGDDSKERKQAQAPD